MAHRLRICRITGLETGGRGVQDWSGQPVGLAELWYFSDVVRRVLLQIVFGQFDNGWRIGPL